MEFRAPKARDFQTLAWRLARYPFTVATCGFIVFGGLLSRTATGQTITRRALRQFGSAPRDLLAFNLGRVVISAFVTDGGIVFWMALALTALFAGAAEHFTDTTTATLTFWGAHFASFLVSIYVTLPLDLTGSRLAALLYVTRDVGPSAGYVGCLGLALVCSRWRWRWWLIGAVAVGLGTALLLSLPELRGAPRDVSADLAHASALVFGVVTGSAILLVRRMRLALAATE
jgi:cell division protein FtsW (lipid II flippase)